MSKTSDLLALLSECQPSNEKIKHVALIENIKDMDEYKELACMKAYQEIYKNFFVPEKLEMMQGDKLVNVKSAIAVLPEVMQDLIFSIKNGNGNKLVKTDIPDFYSLESLKAFQDKISTSNGVNITNIEPENCMRIFEETTIKSSDEIFYNLPFNSQGSKEDIERILSNSYFCVDQNEINNLEQKYQDQMAELRNERKLIKKGWVNRLLIRIALWMLASLIPLTVNVMIGGTISGAALTYSTIIIFLLGIIFVIGG